MNREETAFGVDSLVRLIGIGEDNDRRSQVRNEHPGDANHKSASVVMVKNSKRWKYGLSFKTLFAYDAEPDGGPVGRRVPIHRSQNFQTQLRSHGAVTLPQPPRTIS